MNTLKFVLCSQIALLLLENGADPNATDKLDSTPLHRASAKGNYRLIQLLIKQSASTNIQDSQGNTALYVCRSVCLMINMVAVYEAKPHISFNSKPLWIQEE